MSPSKPAPAWELRVTRSKPQPAGALRPAAARRAVLAPLQPFQTFRRQNLSQITKRLPPSLSGRKAVSTKRHLPIVPLSATQNEPDDEKRPTLRALINDIIGQAPHSVKQKALTWRIYYIFQYVVYINRSTDRTILVRRMLMLAIVRAAQEN